MYGDNDTFQAGLCTDSRTIDNIFILMSVIEKQKFVGKPLFLCFVDFTKAFDFINRDALYYKLKLRGINGNYLDVIKNMFKKAKNRVRWQGQLTDNINSVFGVLQGGIISPKLFNEYISDIGTYLSKESGIYLDELLLYYLLYADDLVLFADSENGLQTQLNMLFSYCQKWHFIVSLPKTKVMVFHRRQAVPQIYFDNQLLEVVKTFKYLGVTFDSSSKHPLSSSYLYLAEQARKALFSSLKLYVLQLTWQAYANLYAEIF